MAIDGVSVLLATYNGAKFIDEQLESIEAQQVDKINIWVSDDGSTDDTLDILLSWQRRWRKGEFHLLKGPGKGYVENFRYLVLRADAESSYLAFSDQDDIWDRDKLSVATANLDSVPPSCPGLYCGRTRLISSNGQFIGMSPRFKRGPSFPNSLVQSLAGGNTMVLNNGAARLLVDTCQVTSFVSHDWWSYQIVTGAGGQVIYDPQPHLGYRQHEDNIIGKNQGWRARTRRIAALADGRFAKWMECNVSALELCRDKLTDQNKEILDALQEARKTGSMRAVYNLGKNGIRRQTYFSDFALYAAAALGKL